MTLRVGFAGTPVFAERALRAIAQAGYSLPLVLSRPDRPKGRGMDVQGSPVKAAALELGLRVMQPATLRSAGVQAELLAIPLDVLVVAAYGLILPQAVLDWPRIGALNIHASLLPRWRGAAPIERAIEAGDGMSGVSIMRMDAGLDTGPVLRMRSLDIAPRETAGLLHDRLAALGTDLMLSTLATLAKGEPLPETPQPAEGVTYAARIRAEEALLDFREDAAALDRRVRAFNPAPGAFAMHAGHRVKIWEALPLPDTAGAEPGTVLAVTSAGIDVACGKGCLRLMTLQRAGSRRMSATQAQAGRLAATGDRFDIPAGPAPGGG